MRPHVPLLVMLGVCWLALGIGAATGWVRTAPLLPAGIASVVVTAIAMGVVARVRRGAGAFAWAIPAAILVGAWSSTTHRVPREVARLGGWFTGHGNFVSDITGTLTHDFSLIANPTRPDRLALSPGGRFAASASFREGPYVWDVGEERRVLDLSDQDASWFGFTPDAPRFVTVGAGGMRVYDTETWALLAERPAPGAPAGSAASHWPPLGVAHGAEPRVRLVLRHNDVLANLVEVLDLPAGTKRELPFSRGSHIIALSADGTRLLSAGAAHLGRLEIYDIDAGRSLDASFAPHGTSTPPPLALSADGRHGALLHGATLWIYAAEDAEPGRAVKALPPDELSSLTYFDPPLLAFAPGGRRVAIATSRFGGINASPAAIHIIDLVEGRLVETARGHLDRVAALAWDATGRFLVTGSRDQTVRIWAAP